MISVTFLGAGIIMAAQEEVTFIGFGKSDWLISHSHWATHCFSSHNLNSFTPTEGGQDLPLRFPRGIRIQDPRITSI